MVNSSNEEVVNWGDDALIYKHTSIDEGLETGKPITCKAEPAFSYVDGALDFIEYTDGTTKTLTYNGDGTLNTVVIEYVGRTPITKTMVWNAGILTAVTVS